MRILMLSDVYFPRVNGVSTSIATFRAELAALGHEVALFCPDYPAPHDDDPAIRRLSAWPLFFDPEDRLLRRAPAWRVLRALSAPPDLIHVQTPFVAHGLGLRLAQRLGAPVVATYHTLFEEYVGHYLPWLPGGPMRRLARALARRQCGRLDRLIVPSRATAERLAGYGVATPCEVIPTGLPEASFRRSDGLAFRRRQRIRDDQFLLGFIGRVAFEKNIGFLLEVLVRVRESLPDVVLVIVGEGPARSMLERRVGRLGLAERVRFIGYLDRHRALNDAYCALDAFVFASRTETQGLVLLEAMALGVPVISTAEMGTREVLVPGRGALVVSEETAAFSAAILRLAKDPGLRSRLAESGRLYAREWSARRMAKQLSGLYRREIDAAAARPRRSVAPLPAVATLAPGREPGEQLPEQQYAAEQCEDREQGDPLPLQSIDHRCPRRPVDTHHSARRR